MKELGITKKDLMKKLDGEGIEIGFCPSCGHGARRLPKKGVDFCENPDCNWQKKYIGNTLLDVPKKENIGDKSKAREHVDRIWKTEDLYDISEFNIPLSTAVGMMENFSNEQNTELLERYNEAIEVLQEVNKDLIVLHGNIYQELKKGNSQWEGVDEIIFKRIEANKQTISKANGK